MDWNKFYDGSLHTNGTHHPMDAIDYPPQPKRPHTSSILNPSPFLYPMPIHSNLFDYSHPYQPSFHTNAPEMLNSFERCRDNITVRDVSSMNSGFSEPRASLNTGTGNTLGLKNDEEWKNINTMLNCILSMVEKTKRALAILQQRGSSTEPPENNDIKRVCSEIMAATVRQTEERVAEVRRRAEDAVNQVKRQALLDLQRAVGAAETKALELVAAERSKMERLLADARKHSPPPAASRDVSPPPATSNQQNMCWNCGRKAQETCSGCNQARYCGAFCQHKDWENHHQVCCGRDLKPTTILTTSPPVSQPNKALPRSTTPISTSSTTERHPIAPERLGVTPERLGIGPERLGVGPERLGVGPERLGVAAERLSVAAERLGVVPERHITDRHQLSSERLPVSENRLSLNNAERMPSVAQSANERITLAALSTAQGLIGGIGGKK